MMTETQLVVAGRLGLEDSMHEVMEAWFHLVQHDPKYRVLDDRRRAMVRRIERVNKSAGAADMDHRRWSDVEGPVAAQMRQHFDAKLFRAEALFQIATATLVTICSRMEQMIYREAFGD